MITEQGGDTLLTDTPESVRGVWILTGLLGLFVVIGLALGIDFVVDGEYGVSVAGFGIAAFFGLFLRMTLLRYRITVSDDQVRIQRLFRPLVLPKEESARRDEIMGYYVEQYRGIRFAIYKNDGERLCCLVRTFTITVPELTQAMQRHGIPRCGPRGRRLDQPGPVPQAPKPTES